jgi:alkaline phosphatase D
MLATITAAVGCCCAVAAQTTLARFEFASCNKPEQETPLWTAMASREPAVVILGGDNIYADQKLPHPLCPLDPKHCPPNGWEAATSARLKDLYAQLDAVPSFAHLRQSLVARANAGVSGAGAGVGARGDAEDDDALPPAPPTLVGTWDDHDFGLNDGDSTLSIRSESAKHFLDFLHEPADSARRSRAGGGVYTLHTHDLTTPLMRRAGRSMVVATILLDLRYHKDPYTKDGTGDFLGEAQWVLVLASCTMDSATNHRPCHAFLFWAAQ